MNKIIKSIFVVGLYFSFGILIAEAQVDSSHKDEEQLYRFARFLKTEKEYKFAVEEFERLNYLYPNNINYIKDLLYCSRQNGEFNRIASQFKIDNNTPKDIIFEYALGMVGVEKNNDAIQLITSNGILKDEKYGPNGGKFIYAVDLLNGKFPEDNHLISDQKLLSLKVEYINMPTKSPVKAGILSTMLPGSGRVYTNDWKNGLLGFLFIAGTGWQSYSRFKKSGISSVGGWIYGGLSVGFYLGNIYGSVVSAKKYNRSQKKRIDEKTHRYLSGLSM